MDARERDTFISIAMTVEWALKANMTAPSSSPRAFRQTTARLDTLAGTIVQRQVTGLYAACDAESADLQAMSIELFGSRGQPRYLPIKSGEEAEVGGFLYISTFAVTDR